MKCDMCDTEATVFLTQIVDGKMTQVNLCDKCSKDKGVTDPTGFQLADFLMGTVSQKKVRASVVDDDNLACPECGFTRAHLKKIGRMGCPNCYQTFGDDLEGMLRAMHKGTRHVGKVPSRQGTSSPAFPGPTPLLPLAASDIANPPSNTEPSKAPAAAPLPPPSPSKKSPSAAVNVKKKLAELKEAIEHAIEEERYEDAARLRDEVKAMEAKA